WAVISRATSIFSPSTRPNSASRSFPATPSSITSPRPREKRTCGGSAARPRWRDSWWRRLRSAPCWLWLRSAMAAVDPSARIEPGAVIGKDVPIGPYCVVGANVVIDDGCRLVAHVHVEGHTKIGARTVVYPFASIGTAPQSTAYHGEPTRLVIGTDCEIREGVTMNIGTEDGGGLTQVGDRGLFMANSHVAHDCRVGSDVIFANCATLGGHCDIGDYVFIGGLSAVHQFSHIGAHAMISGMTGIRSDVIPFGLAAGPFARLSGINVVGM